VNLLEEIHNGDGSFVKIAFDIFNNSSVIIKSLKRRGSDRRANYSTQGFEIMRKITLPLQPQAKRVEVIIAPHFLFSETAVNAFKHLASRFALFCDETVASLYGNKWALQLQKLGLNLVLCTFPNGEQEKSRERKAELEDLLFSQKFGRDTGMIALGGGVATDLIGFLASTYCRGVPLIFAPTTLLAMVDAAIGGKTGINTRFGKNLIGTYYPADKILIDTSVLASLPQSEWINGLAEVIKYALIHSQPLFERLKNWDPKNSDHLENIIDECISIKAQVIEIDYEEKTGLRRILNFGHTIAHALELLENFRLAHGEAVAIGMLVESDISMKMGHLSDAALAEIENLITSFPFSLKISPAITLEKMHATLALDKKVSKGAVRFVLLEKIGACNPFNGEYCFEVPKNILDDVLTRMMTRFGAIP
jgi:3-dehydroquinate synthase